MTATLNASTVDTVVLRIASSGSSPGHIKFGDITAAPTLKVDDNKLLFNNGASDSMILSIRKLELFGAEVASMTSDGEHLIVDYGTL